MAYTDTTVNNLVINKMTQAQYDALSQKSDTELYLVPDNYDTVPTNNSDNPITSGGVYTALGAKQDTIDSSHKLNADFIVDGTTNKVINTIESIEVNGVALTPNANKAVNVQVPTNNNQLQNGEGYITSADITSKEDKIAIETPTLDANNAFTAAAGKYYVVQNAVGSLQVNLPDLRQQIAHVQNVIVYFATNTTASPQINFAGQADSNSVTNVVTADGLSFGASSKYEVNCLWNGTNWLIVAVKFN